MQPTTMLPKLTDVTQTILFSEGDGVCSAETYATDVVVTTNAGNHDHGSSKVKLKNLVDYNWEPKFYSGQLLAIHMSGKYLAYCIKAANALNPGTWNGMVRVVYNPECGSDRRALIKGMKGEVQDLSFANIQNQVILACIDEQGNFYVHEIEVTDSGLRCTLVAEIREDSPVASSGHRVVWCPYIPDDDDDAPDEDVAKLLLTTHGNVGRIWNMRVIAGLVGSQRAASAAELLGGAGARAAAEHGAPLVAAAFSPDGSALATAATDGYVMFFQVYMHSDASPRCLHKWQPHAGKPLSCLFFLDNHTNYNSDAQFWKFAVTGAEANTVLKVWSCKTWNCIQTITFTPSLTGETLGLKAMLDRSASYLILSDFKARSLYVLNMARDTDDTVAYCKSIAEYLLPYPVLSFCIIGAEERPVSTGSSCDEPFMRNGSTDGTDDNTYDVHQHEVEETSSGGSPRVCVRLYIVQPKGLQEGRLEHSPLQPAALLQGMSELSLEPSAPEEALAASILQQQSQQLKNMLRRAQGSSGSAGRAESPPPAHQLNLMTPDAFSSPGKREDEEEAADTSTHRNNTSVGAVVEGGGCKLTSGGSSPSREVQQIMSHTEAHYYDKDLEEPLEEVDATEAAAESVPNGEQMFPEELYPDGDVIDDVFPKTDEQAHTGGGSGGGGAWPQISVAQLASASQRAPPDHDRRLDAIQLKLDNLIELVSSQAREVRLLRDQSPRALDAALEAHAQRTARAIDDALSRGWERISVASEAAAARAATAAGAGAARALEPLAAALQHELAAKLTATDHLLRDNIEKLANSKTVTERLSGAVAGAVTAAVREAFRAALFDSVLPVMEKAHAQIFRQINHAFQAGTKEFAANTEAAARAAAERGGAAGSAALRAALERHAEALARHAAAAAPPPLQQITAAVHDAAHSVLEKEMSWWREQTALQLSRAHSPATPSAHDRQMQVSQIQSLMKSGDVNGAFQVALSASDLALVVAACRAGDVAAVFGPPCALRQHVLLSLVQQLAADLPQDTQLKHRYLEEAVMNLDTSNPVTREHLPAVVRELQKQIVSFLNAQPSHALARQFRMLLMATDSLVKGAA